MAGKTAILSVRIVSMANNAGFKKATRDIEAFKKRAEALDQSIGKVGARIGKFASRVGSIAAPIAKVTAIAGAATVGIAGMAPALVAVGGAAAAALGPMIALTAAMAPAALGAAALMAGVLATSFKGVGEAINAESAEDFAAAIADMPPAMQSGVTALRDLKSGFTELGATIQESFWSNLSNIGQLESLIAPIGSALEGLAMDMGNAAAGLVDFVSQGTGLSAMQTLISNSGLAASSLSYAFADVLKGIISVGAAASPIFAEISQALADMAAGWSEKMAAAFADGSLEEYFRSAVDGARGLGDVLSDVGGIIGGVFSAINAAGQPMLGTIGQVIAATNEWVNSVEGMSALTTFFESMGAAVGALLPIIGQIAAIIGTTVAPAIAELVTILAPAASALVDAFGSVLQAIAPLVGPIGELVALIGGTLAAAIQAVAPLLQAVGEALGGVILAAVQAISPIMPVIVDAFSQLATGLMPLVPVLTEVGTIMAGALSTAIQTLAPILPIIVGAFTNLLGAIVPLLPPIAQIAGALLPALAQVAASLAPVIAAVVGVVVQLLGALSPLLPPIAQLAGILFPMLANVISNVMSIMTVIIGVIGRVAAVLVGALATGLAKGISLFNRVASAISTVVSWVSNLIGKLTSIRWPSPPGWLSSLFGGGIDPFDFGPGPGGPGAPGGMTTAAPSDFGWLRAARGADTVSAPGGDTVVNVNVSVSGALVGTTAELGEVVAKSLRDYQRQSGKSPAVV